MKGNLQKVFLVMAFAAAMSLIFITPLCGILFECGCDWIWAGAAARCNVHHSEPPFCPWCSHGSVGFTLPAVGLFLGTFLCGFFFLQKCNGKLLPALIVTVAAIVPIGVGLGYVTILLTSYPYFIIHP